MLDWQTKLKQYVFALIRTWVPIAIGAAISWLLTKGVHISSQLQDAALLGLTALLQGLYYAVVYFAQKYIHPKFGWLLGVAKMPTYVVEPTPAGTPVDGPNNTPPEPAE